jgi:hypothetical protein
MAGMLVVFFILLMSFSDHLLSKPDSRARIFVDRNAGKV